MIQGTIQNPISLQDDEQDQSEHKALLDAARNKILIEQALITGQPLQLCFAVIKTTIFGDLPTKQRGLNKAIIRYFKQKLGKNLSCDYFHPRIEPDQDCQMIPKQVLIYGVDFLTTSSLKQRFTILNAVVKQIIWINDSTCKIIYDSDRQVQNLIEDQSKYIKIQQDNNQLPKGWFPIKSYNIFSFERQLQIRYATSKQKDIEKDMRDWYQKFISAKNEMAHYLLTQFKALQKYKQIVSKQNENKFGQRRRQNNKPYFQRREHSRSRDRFRNNQFQRSQHRNHRGGQSERYQNRRSSRYNNGYESIRQITTVKYAHRPADTSFREIDNQDHYSSNRNKNNRQAGLNESLQYIDYKAQSERRNNNDTSFRFNFNRDNIPVYNHHNDSFHQIDRPRRRYDDVESQISYNHGSVISYNNHERYDYNSDFNIREQKFQKKDKGGQISFIYDSQKQQKNNINNSFNFILDNSKIEKSNQSFIYNKSKSNKKLNQSFNYNQSNDKNKKQKQPQDFFDLLNSVTSSVHQRNQQDFSFKHEKDNKSEKKKQFSKILNQSFFNQDSY